MNIGWSDVEIVTAIICDDARKENNGKSILIGVYAGDILLKEIPGHVGLALWVHANVSKCGEFLFHFRFVGTQGKPVGEIEGKATIKTAGAAVISIPPIPVFLESVGDLTVEMKVGDSEWKPIRSIEIKKMDQTIV